MAHDETPDKSPATLGDGELVRAANRLTDAINELGTDSGRQFENQADTLRRTRRAQRALLIGLVVEGLIVIGFTFAGFAIVHNQRGIDALTNRLNISQTITRQRSLCPLYQLLLDANTPGAAQAAPNPVQYAHAIAVIEDGYKALNCSDFTKKAPPSPTPNPIP